MGEALGSSTFYNFSHFLHINIDKRLVSIRVPYAHRSRNFGKAEEYGCGGGSEPKAPIVVRGGQREEIAI
jgi:hypothetical protein